MSSDVDAVIAALRVVLREVETCANFSRTNFYWKTHIVNKWIYQLPGARWADGASCGCGRIAETLLSGQI